MGVIHFTSDDQKIRAWRDFPILECGIDIPNSFLKRRKTDLNS